MDTCNGSVIPDSVPAPSRREGGPCPSCGALEVYRSRRKGIPEHLLALVGARIRRCHACNVRFARLFNSVVYIDDGRRPLHRAVLLLLAGAVLVVLVMVWFMRKQESIGPSDGLLYPPRQGTEPRS